MTSESRRAHAPTPPRTLFEALARALRVPAAFALGASAVLWVGGSVLVGPSDAARPENEVVAEQGAATPSPPGAQQRAAGLVRDHGCWTGEAPASLQGQLPGHVVLSHRVDGEVVTIYGGEVWVGRALEELFGDGDPRVVTVHGFCR